jgi:hypothetical protein
LSVATLFLQPVIDVRADVLKNNGFTITSEGTAGVSGVVQ